MVLLRAHMLGPDLIDTCSSTIVTLLKGLCSTYTTSMLNTVLLLYRT